MNNHKDLMKALRTGVVTEQRVVPVAEIEETMNRAADVIELIMRTLSATAFYNCSDVFWRVDEEYAPITFFVNCDDLFFWGCSDAEPVTIENIGELERAYKDSPNSGAELFCCRVRGMRPQLPYYKYIDKNEKHLFDACGPERL